MKNSETPFKRPQSPGLTRICRSIRAETLPMFYKLNVFSLPKDGCRDEQIAGLFLDYIRYRVITANPEGVAPAVISFPYPSRWADALLEKCDRFHDSSTSRCRLHTSLKDKLERVAKPIACPPIVLQLTFRAASRTFNVSFRGVQGTEKVFASFGVDDHLCLKSQLKHLCLKSQLIPEPAWVTDEGWTASFTGLPGFRLVHESIGEDFIRILQGFRHQRELFSTKVC